MNGGEGYTKTFVHGLCDQIGELNVKLAASNKDCTDLVETIGGLQDQVEELKTKVAVVTFERDDGLRHVGQLRTEIEELQNVRSANASLYVTLNKLRKDLSVTEFDLAASVASHNKTTEQLTIADKENKRLAFRVDELGALVTSLRAAPRVTVKDGIAYLQGVADEAHATEDQLTFKHLAEIAAKKNEELEERVEQLTRDARLHDADMRSINEARDLLTAQLEVSERGREHHEGFTTELARRRDQLLTDLQKSNELGAKLAIENKELDEMVEKLTKTRHELEKQLCDEQFALTRLDDANRSLSHENDRARHEVEHLKAQLGDQELAKDVEYVAELQAANIRITQEREELKTKLKQAETCETQVSRELRDQLSRERGHHVDQVRDLNEKLVSVDSERLMFKSVVMKVEQKLKECGWLQAVIPGMPAGHHIVESVHQNSVAMQMLREAVDDLRDENFKLKDGQPPTELVDRLGREGAEARKAADELTIELAKIDAALLKARVGGKHRADSIELLFMTKVDLETKLAQVLERNAYRDEVKESAENQGDAVKELLGRLVETQGERDRYARELEETKDAVTRLVPRLEASETKLDAFDKSIGEEVEKLHVENGLLRYVYDKAIAWADVRRQRMKSVILGDDNREIAALLVDASDALELVVSAVAFAQKNFPLNASVVKVKEFVIDHVALSAIWKLGKSSITMPPGLSLTFDERDAWNQVIAVAVAEFSK